MKTFLKFTALSAVLLMLAVGLGSCRETEDSYREIENWKNFCLGFVERPENLKTIDWDNYNDVHTVFWTYHKREVQLESWIYEDTANIIKIYGWVAQNSEQNDFQDLWFSYDFVLIGNDLGYNVSPHVPFVIVGDSIVKESIKEKLATADLTRRIFVRGRLSFPFERCGTCCFTFPLVRIYSADDIYFE